MKVAPRAFVVNMEKVPKIMMVVMVMLWFQSKIDLICFPGISL